MRKCETCGTEIPAARLAALPETATCAGCSTEEPVRGHTWWDGKHTPVLEVTAGPSRFEGRKGFHAQLPLNSTNNVRMVSSMANRDLSLQIREEPPVEFTIARPNPSRCHPDRPRATPDGKCVECALAWYRR